VLAKAMTAVFRCFHGLGQTVPDSTETKQNAQEDPMPETIARSHGTRRLGSACCPTNRMCGMRRARQRQLPRR
jgi:hypothetical protein